MTVVRLDPLPLYVRSVELVNIDPEFLVLDRLTTCGFPPILFPTVDPLCDAILEVTAVGVNCYCLFSSVFETLESRGEFHRIVRSMFKSTRQLKVRSYDSPAPRSRVSETASVCVHLHLFVVFTLNFFI